MKLDDIDIEILKENFDEELINQMDIDNVGKIIRYLLSNGIDFFNDIFISNFDLFLFEYEEFVERFEKLKKDLGNNYIDLLKEDISLIYKFYY